MIIYKTTNLKNNKTYIGKDLKNNPDYLGSGSVLKSALKKYGRINFKKEILCFCNSVEELNEKEKYFIKYFKSINKAEYNIAEGGIGGNTLLHASEDKKEQFKKKTSIASKGRYKGVSFDEKYGDRAEHIRQKIVDKCKNRKMPEKTKLILINLMKGKSYEERFGIEKGSYLKEIRKKLSKKLKVMNITTGKVFDSIKEASRFYKVKDSNISLVCKGKRNSAGSYEWKYV